MKLPPPQFPSPLPPPTGILVSLLLHLMKTTVLVEKSDYFYFFQILYTMQQTADKSQIGITPFSLFKLSFVFSPLQVFLCIFKKYQYKRKTWKGKMMKAAVRADSYNISSFLIIILELKRCLLTVARQVSLSFLITNIFFIIKKYQVILN